MPTLMGRGYGAELRAPNVVLGRASLNGAIGAVTGRDFGVLWGIMAARLDALIAGPYSYASPTEVCGDGRSNFSVDAIRTPKDGQASNNYHGDFFVVCGRIRFSHARQTGTLHLCIGGV
jgi:hypothetical protein